MTTEHECIAALREAANRLGESPTKADYEDLGLCPASATILRVMGGWNAAKEAAGLETNPSYGSRTQPKPDYVDLSDDTEWAALSQDQRWHYRNREYNTQRSNERRADLRRWVYRIKADSDGCTRCEESDPACLDFHHISGTDKRMALNEMVSFGYSTAKLHEEIDKCRLLCANCHWKEHHGDTARRLLDSTDFETREERLRAWSYRYKRQRGCQQCDETDPICLQFHHPREKRAGLGAMIADGADEQRIREEADRSVVLCANCHRRVHYTPPDTSGPHDAHLTRDDMSSTHD